MIGEAPPLELIDWAEVAVGSKVVSVVREFAGGSRPLWYLAFESGEECVLRLDDGSGALSGSPYSIQREVDVYRGLVDSAVPVPIVHAARGFDDGFVILMNRVQILCATTRSNGSYRTLTGFPGLSRHHHWCRVIPVPVTPCSVTAH